MLPALKIFASDLVVREGEEAVMVQQHVDQVGELALVARGEEAVTDHVDNLHILTSSVVVAIFNQENALIAFFSLIVQLKTSFETLLVI